MGRINHDEPIDVTSLVNAGEVNIDIYKKQYGIHLTEEVGRIETPTVWNV